MVGDVQYGGHDDRILGGEVTIRRASREPCLICGHPTGDCTGDAPPPTVLVGSTTFPSLGHEDIYVVTEDVWEERQITPFTKAKVLVAAIGTTMPLDKAKELGLL